MRPRGEIEKASKKLHGDCQGWLILEVLLDIRQMLAEYYGEKFIPSEKGEE